MQQRAGCCWDGAWWTVNGQTGQARWWGVGGGGAQRCVVLRGPVGLSSVGQPMVPSMGKCNFRPADPIATGSARHRPGGLARRSDGQGARRRSAGTRITHHASGAGVGRGR